MSISDGARMSSSFPMLRNGSFSNLAPFPGNSPYALSPGCCSPTIRSNTGAKPLLIGSRERRGSQLNTSTGATTVYLRRGADGLRDLGGGGAADVMQLKLAFAFGRIRPSHELVNFTVVSGSIGGAPEWCLPRRCAPQRLSLSR